MAKSSKQSLLGIDIQSDSIVLVELSGHWGEMKAMSGGSILLPPGTIVSGQIVDTTLVAQRIRDLMNRLHISTRDAIMGIPPSATNARVMELPPIPHDELRPIVANELALSNPYGLPPEAYDFLQLGKPESPEDTTPLPAIVFSADTLVSQSYMDVAVMAGINLLAIEPISLAMYRASIASHPMTEATLWVSVGSGDIEVAVVEEGIMQVYRRLDINGETLFNSAEEPSPLSTEEMPQFDIGAESAFTATSQGAIPKRASGFHSLLMELQRSLEYYQRRRRDNPIQQIIVITSRVTLQSLPDMLASRLGVPAYIITLDNVEEFAEKVGAKSEEALLRYVGAAGLAMYYQTPNPLEIPCFDLRVHVHEIRQMRQVSKKAVLSLVASIGILVLITMSSLRVGMESNNVDHLVSHAKEELKALQTEKQKVVDTQQATLNLVHTIQSDGFAFPRVMDTIAQATAPHVGLTEISITQTGHINLIGDSREEIGTIKALEGLKKSSLFMNTVVESYTRNGEPGKPTSLHFLISADIAGMGEPLAKVAGGL